MSLLDRFRLDGKVAVVTGASRGIGAASATALAEAGADLVIAARSADTLAGVTKEIESLGRRAVAVPCDLSDLGNMQALIDAATSELGGVDVVVNNVGGSMPQPFLDTTTKTMEDAFHFNVSTAFELTRLAVPALLERGGGSVINITSVMGHLSDRGFAAYGTAKGAMTHMTHLVAADLAPKIRVNAIAVGSIATSALDIVLQDDGLRTEMESSTPLGRIGDPEEIAATVLFLASAAGGYVTGKVVEVDGGIEQPNLDMGLPDL
jgi:7-alpha-hydroxysteroid dehydrogenase